VLLCALRDGRIDVNYLRALRDPEVNWITFLTPNWKARVLRAGSPREALLAYLSSGLSELGSLEEWATVSQGRRRYRLASAAVHMLHGAGQSVMFSRIAEPPGRITFEEETEQEGRTA
jgi:hypothetical protein